MAWHGHRDNLVHPNKGAFTAKLSVHTSPSITGEEAESEVVFSRYLTRNANPKDADVYTTVPVNQSFVGAFWSKQQVRNRGWDARPFHPQPPTTKITMCGPV